MTSLRKKSNRKKRSIQCLTVVFSCVLLLAAIAFVIISYTDVLGKYTEESMKTEQEGELPDNNEEGDKQPDGEGTGQNQPDNNGEEDKQPDGEGTGQNQPDNNGEEDKQPDGEGTGQGQSDSSQMQPGSASNTLNNPKIENVESLNNISEGWGPGNDVNEKNQPYSVLSYQKKYEKYNANFVVADSDKIYLTFDEGYENGYTPSILDTLKEKNVKAVFFVTSQFAKKNPELIQRMIDEGHMVGNHSVTHPSAGLPSQSIEQQQQEVLGLHDYIKENFNYEMHLFRYPAGIFSEQSLAVLNNCNYKSVFWSFAYLDYDTNNQPDPTWALDKLMNKLHPGAIYLLHAVSATNTEILDDFIDQVRASGYEFALFE